MADDMSTQSTLSSRGLALASQPSFRAFATPVLQNLYDLKDNPNGNINLGAAENYIMLPWVADFTNKNFHATPNMFSYDQGAWGSNRLRAALAKHMNRYFHPVEAVNPDDLLVANGCMSLCEMLGFSIFSPGDGVLLSRPCYSAFESDFGTRVGVKCVYAAFNGEDQFSPKGAVQGYENALQEAQANGTPIRALLICHPHNPLGQSYPPETLIALMQFCEAHKIHLISDEIYALSTYTLPNTPDSSTSPPTPTVPFRSILTIPNRAAYIHPDRLHLLYGMSKDLAGGGLRIGTLYTRNSELWRCLSAMNQFHWVPGPADALATAMLEDEAWLDAFLAESQRKLSETSTLTRQLLREKGIPFWEAGRAGFFLWVDLRAWLEGTGKEDAWEAEREINGRFTECGVFLSSGESMKALDFTGYSVSRKANYHVRLDLYKEIDPSASKTNHTSRAVEFVLQKKDLEVEFWPRLLKDAKKVHFLKTDFDKWVDEDEQDEVAEDDDYMSRMGGMQGMGGEGMGGMGGMGGDGGFGGIDFSKLGGMGGMPDMSGMGGMGDEGDDDEDDDEMPELEDEEAKGGADDKPKIEEVA